MKSYKNVIFAQLFDVIHRGADMKFKITYTDGRTEIIEGVYDPTDDGKWTDFCDGNGLRLRIRSADVERIDSVTA